MKFGDSKKLSRGFTQQQALFMLVLFFPLILAAIGLAIALVKRVPGAIPSSPIAPPSLAPASPAPTTEIAPEENGQTGTDQLNEGQARAVIEKWLSMKAQIFAPPFDKKIADEVVAEGPLWRDLTKTDGSIDWLQKNNSYYTYNSYRINGVTQFSPSSEMPTITISLTEDSVLHSPKGNAPSVKTGNWLYTLKQENGAWKVWDYKKQ